MKNISNFPTSNTFAAPSTVDSYDHSTSYNHSTSYDEIDNTDVIWLGNRVFILITALPANSALLWLMLKSRHNLSPSQLLALNISIVGIVYCLLLPFDFCDLLSGSNDVFLFLWYYMLVLNMFGCPLFLTLMCLERFVAIAFPITYLQLNKTKPRIIVSAVTWITTVFMAFMLYLFESSDTLIEIGGIIFFLLFLIMLICLFGLVWVLRQSGPGERANSSSNLLKKRAIVNIITVIVPTGIAYGPFVALFIATITGLYNEKGDFRYEMWFAQIFTKFGFYIGPLFYLTALRKITCCCPGPRPC